MLATGFKIYPSGFVGSSKTPQTTPMTLFDAAAILTNSTNHKEIPKYTADISCVSLWKTYADQQGGLSLDDTEIIYKTAKAAFGSPTLIEWLYAQLSSQHLSQTHLQWLLQTIGFVVYRERRSMNLTLPTLMRLLSAGSDRAPGLTPERLFTKPYTYDDIKNLSMGDFLVMWMAAKIQTYPGSPLYVHGIEDLLVSLQVLFGERQT